jgi:hypothetical protein
LQNVTEPRPGFRICTVEGHCVPGQRPRQNSARPRDYADGTVQPK